MSELEPPIPFKRYMRVREKEDFLPFTIDSVRGALRGGGSAAAAALIVGAPLSATVIGAGVVTGALAERLTRKHQLDERITYRLQKVRERLGLKT